MPIFLVFCICSLHADGGDDDDNDDTTPLFASGREQDHSEVLVEADRARSIYQNLAFYAGTGIAGISLAYAYIHRGFGHSRERIARLISSLKPKSRPSGAGYSMVPQELGVLESLSSIALLEVPEDSIDSVENLRRAQELKDVAKMYHSKIKKHASNIQLLADELPVEKFEKTKGNVSVLVEAVDRKVKSIEDVIDSMERTGETLVTLEAQQRELRAKALRLQMQIEDLQIRLGMKPKRE